MADRLRRWALLCLAGTLHQAPAALAGELYRWVDDKGVVHYSDRLPAEATGKASAQLSRQGTVLKHNAPALTPEQIAAREAEIRKRAEAEKQALEQVRRNEALLKTYASEQDIDDARERALSLNRESIRTAQHNLSQAEARRDELALQAKQYEAQGKPLPAKLQREIEVNEADLRNHRMLFEAKQREVTAIVQRYEDDKRRYLELTSKTVGTTAKK